MMDCETLINAVAIRDALWNVRNGDHHNNVVLNRLWEEVAMALESNQEEVRKKWKTLRDSFQRHLHNSKGRSGSAAKKQIRWPYFEQMTFLKDTMIAKKMHSNLPNFQDSDADEHSIHSQSPTPQPQPQVSPLSAPSAPVTPVSRGCNSTISSSSSSSSTTSKRSAVPSNSKSLDPPSQVLRSDRLDAIKKNSKDSWGKELLNVEKRKLELLQAQEQAKKARTIDDNNDDHFFLKSLLPMIRDLPAAKKLRYRIKLLEFTEKFLLENGNSANLIQITPFDFSAFVNVECNDNED